MIPIVLDTNVLISGIFWSGYPYQILEAWRNKKVKIIYSSQILDEYIRIGKGLSRKYPLIDISPFIELMVIHGQLQEPIQLQHPVSRDPDDDKFIACALSANCNIIVSGDSDLLIITGYSGIEVLKPSTFVNTKL